jgi:transcriptional regulator with XRE-family HTH domain
MARRATINERPDPADRLAQIRKDVGLSQAEFAASLGMPLNTYANYERGVRELPFGLAEALWRVYSIDPVWLWNEDVAPHYGRNVDAELLETVVESLAKHLESSSAPLKPKALAQAVSALYTLSVEHGPMGEDGIATVVRMATSANGRR